MAYSTPTVAQGQVIQHPWHHQIINSPQQPTIYHEISLKKRLNPSHSSSIDAETRCKKLLKTTTSYIANDYNEKTLSFPNIDLQYFCNELFNKNITKILKSQTRTDIETIRKIYTDYYSQNKLPTPVSYSPSVGVTLEKIRAFVVGLDSIREVTYHYPLFAKISVDNISCIAKSLPAVLEMSIHSHSIENKKMAQKLFSFYPDKDGWVIRHFFTNPVESVLNMPHKFHDQFKFKIIHFKYPKLFKKLLKKEDEPIFNWYAERLKQKKLMESLANEQVHLNLYDTENKLLCLFAEACNTIKKLSFKSKIEIEFSKEQLNQDKEVEELLINLKDPNYEGFSLIADGGLVPCYLSLPQAEFFECILKEKKNIPSLLASLEGSIARGDQFHKDYPFFTVQWRFVMGNVVVQQEKNNGIYPFKQVSVRPNIEVRRLQRLRIENNLNAAIKRLDAASRLNAILFARFGFIEDNFGFQITQNRETIYFQDKRFEVLQQSYWDISCSFTDLYYKYMQSEVNDQTWVRIDQKNYYLIENYPDLKKALLSPLQLRIFDVHTCVPSNSFLRHKINNNGSIKTIHTLPICGDLLDTPDESLISWKDVPLSDEEIHFLRENSQEQEIKNWIMRWDSDSGIYSELNALERKELQELLEPLLRLPIFSLSYQRESNPSITIKDIQNSFALLLATNTLSEDPQIKSTIEKIWEILPSQNLLQKLEKAKSLFPRLTCEQYTVYFERIKLCNDFLTNYLKLKTLNIELDEFKDIINSPSTPLTTIEKASLNLKLNKFGTAYKSNFGSYRKLIKETLKDITPSYFTMLKVMYPNLRDIYGLLREIYTPKEAASRLGKIAYPLEQDLAIARDITFKEGSPEHDLADTLLEVLKTHTFPFHGSWVARKPTTYSNHSL